MIDISLLNSKTTYFFWIWNAKVKKRFSTKEVQIIEK
jgi:hypothetical protein